jgi:hypothetical protein
LRCRPLHRRCARTQDTRGPNGERRTDRSALAPLALLDIRCELFRRGHPILVNKVAGAARRDRRAVPDPPRPRKLIALVGPAHSCASAPSASLITTSAMHLRANATTHGALSHADRAPFRAAPLPPFPGAPPCRCWPRLRVPFRPRRCSCVDGFAQHWHVVDIDADPGDRSTLVPLRLRSFISDTDLRGNVTRRAPARPDRASSPAVPLPAPGGSPASPGRLWERCLCCPDPSRTARTAHAVRRAGASAVYTRRAVALGPPIRRCHPHHPGQLRHEPSHRGERSSARRAPRRQQQPARRPRQRDPMFPARRRERVQGIHGLARVGVETMIGRCGISRA